MLRFLRAAHNSVWRMFCSVGLIDGLGDLLSEGGCLLALFDADASISACKAYWKIQRAVASVPDYAIVKSACRNLH